MFELTQDGGVAIMRIARPPVNAIRFEDWARLEEVVDRLAGGDARAVVVTGAPGPHFSAGNDRTEFGPSTARDIERGTARVIAAIRGFRELPIPCIAAIHGAALGSAMLLCAMCDIRLATPDARIGLPEVLAGAFGGYRLAREVLPTGEARLMVYTGRPITGERAHQLGVVQELAATPEAVLERARELAGEIAGLMNGSLARSARPLLNRIDDGVGLWDGHDLERLTMVRFMGRDGE